MSADLRTINGGVKMDGLKGDIRARTTNGGITGTGIAATNIDAKVTNGGVEIALARPLTTGTYELEAVNGGVTLTLPPDSKADVAARCVNGGIIVDGLDVKVSSESTSTPNEFEQHIEGARKFRRRLDGQMNGGGARVSLETVNGGVRLARADEPTATTRELMHRMGHDSMRAALIYQHATTDRDRRIADAMQDMIDGSRTDSNAASSTDDGDDDLPSGALVPVA